jgi:hypothetical protein
MTTLSTGGLRNSVMRVDVSASACLRACHLSHLVWVTPLFILWRWSPACQVVVSRIPFTNSLSGRRSAGLGFEASSFFNLPRTRGGFVLQRIQFEPVQDTEGDMKLHASAV